MASIWPRENRVSLFFYSSILLFGVTLMFSSLISESNGTLKQPPDASHCFHLKPISCNVSLTESCPASLYFVPKIPKTLEETTSLFHLSPNLVKKSVDGYIIAVNCSCPADHDEFIWHMDYTVQPGDSWRLISSKFGSFILEKPEKMLIASQTVTLDLLCGCFEGKEVVTYRVETGDTLYTICTRFKTDVDKTAKFNKLDNAGIIHDGDILFIPESEGLEDLILRGDKDSEFRKMLKSRTRILMGLIITVAAVLLLLVTIFFWIFYHKRKGRRQSKSSISEFKGNMAPIFNSEKAMVFQYYEVRDATSDFSISHKIGQGSCGSVFHGRLRGTDVAIKQMKNTKSKEFLAELNILGKVHHTNLIELIGYAAGGDSLFLVYEFAQKGALSDHLHNPSAKGYAPLSWTTRVQIALDAAKGLEYIHMHTKPYYVHRDVKTSNILLDSNFRAKIADFGLVKLLVYSPEIGAAASRIVGTFGYLAPEYVRDGRVTTKTDVYSYGVVLMELLTGQPALSKDANTGNSLYTEHRSVVDHMVSALEDKDPLTQLTQCIDPNLMHYHEDSLFQTALLSKDCVDDDWNQRPDMCKVVLRLSHILALSKKWEVQSLYCSKS